MNATTNEMKNAFSEFVCAYKGCTSVLDKSGYTSVLEESYQNTTMQLNMNPYLNDHNIPHFILHIANMDPENRHPVLTIWVPKDGQGNIVIVDDTHIKFVDFYELPPYGGRLITFIFEFASDQHYWPKDDYGPEYEGYINPIFGTADGVTIYGLSAQVIQQLFLKEFRKVVQKDVFHSQQDSEENDNDSGENNGGGAFCGPLYLPSFTDHI